MYYNNYLIHVNNNHYPAGSKQGGQFAPGDGDGDGTIDDHKNQKSDFVKKAELARDIKKTQATSGFVLGAVGLVASGAAFVAALNTGNMAYAAVGGAGLLASAVTIGFSFEDANSAKSVDKLLNDPAKLAIIDNGK